MGNVNGNTTNQWPKSALAAASRAFDMLVAPPATLAIDGTLVGHDLPARAIPLDGLRELLLARTCPPSARDAAWQLLIGYARTWGPAWVWSARLGWPCPA